LITGYLFERQGRKISHTARRRADTSQRFRIAERLQLVNRKPPPLSPHRFSGSIIFSSVRLQLEGAGLTLPEKTASQRALMLMNCSFTTALISKGGFVGQKCSGLE
jgi:hypothetical protein